MSDTTSNTHDDFIERFDALQMEASKYGLTSIVALMDNDPFQKIEDKWVGYSNGHMASLGLLEYARLCILNDLKLGMRKEEDGE